MKSRFALISDIHSNLTALDAVMERIEADGLEEIWCLGDVVGYGAEPNECVEIVRRVADGRTIIGNHDVAVAKAPEGYLNLFNPDAKRAVYYQRETLTEENLEWLAALPVNMQEGDILFYHGSPVDTDHYMMSTIDLYRALKALDGVDFKLVFFGHTHVPTTAAVKPDGKLISNLEYEAPELGNASLALEDGVKYLINPGSVGQPRDRNPRAAYAVVDLEEQIIHFRRVEYDIAEAQRRIDEAGLPGFLSHRLEFGF